MNQPTRTIDLATVAAPSEYIGRRATWHDFEGREHVGVLAPDPFGGPFPVVDFGDGTYGRNGSVVTLVIEPGPLDVDHLRYLGKLHAQGVEYKPFSPQPAPCGVSWRERGLTGSPRTCTRPVGHDGPHGQRGAL